MLLATGPAASNVRVTRLIKGRTILPNTLISPVIHRSEFAVPPKTGDIRYLAARWAEAGTSLDVLPHEVMGRSASDLERIERAYELERQELLKDPFLSIGSSLLFEAAILLWAMAGFMRRDY